MIFLFQQVPEYTINNWNTHSKVDSLSNNHYSPGGGDVKVREILIIKLLPRYN